MKIKEAIKKAINELKQYNIGTYGNDAVILVKTALSKDDVFVLTNPDFELTESEEKTFLDLLQKRKKRYPIAYITKSKEFYGFEFYVDERVLIPRPETEFVVEETLKIANKIKAKKIVDVGTGSGCISISLSKLLNINIFASDISNDALKVAKINARKHGANVEFIVADGIDWIGKKVDIIVSNPPYVSEEEYKNLSDDVKFEPKNALTAKNNGLAFIQYLLKKAKGKCKYLVVEFGYNQSHFIKSHKNLTKVTKDLSGYDRVAVFKFS